MENQTRGCQPRQVKREKRKEMTYPHLLPTIQVGIQEEDNIRNLFQSPAVKANFSPISLISLSSGLVVSSISFINPALISGLKLICETHKKIYTRQSWGHK